MEVASTLVDDTVQGTAKRIIVLVNAKAGTVRASDRDALAKRLKAAARALGKVVSIGFVEPADWLFHLHAAAAREDVDVLIVGGGDGSISSAGSALAGSGKVMGVIPLGTFNLFARSLQIPAGMDTALLALPRMVETSVDVGEIRDGRGRGFVFLHHISLGFHPRFIEMRDATPYASRWGKILASLRVWWQSVASLRRFSLSLSGDVVLSRALYYQAAVAVGSIREGFAHLPHAEDLTEGRLQLILLPARGRLDFLLAALQVLLGRWRSNSRLDTRLIQHVRLEPRRPQMSVSVDGEVMRLDTPLDVTIRPRALKVLRPAEEA